jgi:uncharacterized membrane protein YqhA
MEIRTFPLLLGLFLSGLHVYAFWISPNIGQSWLEWLPPPWIDSKSMVIIFRLAGLLMFAVFIVLATLKIYQTFVRY